jgi:hypothetical protein
MATYCAPDQATMALAPNPAMRWRRRPLLDLRAGTSRVGRDKSSCPARQRIELTSRYAMELGYHVTQAILKTSEPIAALPSA